MRCILFLFPGGIFVYKLETSIATKIVSWPIFVFSIKLMKSVVSFM